MHAVIANVLFARDLALAAAALRVGSSYNNHKDSCLLPASGRVVDSAAVVQLKQDKQAAESQVTPPPHASTCTYMYMYNVM